VLVLMTAQSRARLLDLTAETRALRETEAALLDQLTVSQSAENEVRIPPEATWPHDRIVDLELAVQDTLLSVADRSGLFVVSFGSLGTRMECPVACLTYEIEIEGGHEQMVEFLAEIEAIDPPLSVVNLWIRQLPPDGTVTQAPVSFRLSTLALAPAVSGKGQ
jgi:hypothetical protein